MRESAMTTARRTFRHSFTGGFFRVPGVALIIMALGLSLGGSAGAQDSAAESQSQFAAAATAVDAGTLLTGQTKVRLWGIEPVNSATGALTLQARTWLDDQIAGRPVRCKVLGQKGNMPVAQCFTSQDIELSAEMLRNGFAVVDRPSVLGTVFEKPFFEAERQARSAGKGAWLGLTPKKTYSAEAFFGLALLALVLGPMIGFAAVAGLTFWGFRKMVAVQRAQFDEIFFRQDQLHEREKFVVAAMFEAELNANRIKLEAFLVIYEEMLRNLRDAVRQQRFRQTGEIVHEQPPLNRAVFDAYKDKMELLGPQLAADITKIYSVIEPNPEYITLEPGLPIERAIQKVEGIIDDAKNLMPPTDKALSGLSVIIRDRGKEALSGLSASAEL